MEGLQKRRVSQDVVAVDGTELTIELLAERVAESVTWMTEEKAQRVIMAFLDMIVQEVCETGECAIPRFGRFYTLEISGTVFISQKGIVPGVRTSHKTVWFTPYSQILGKLNKVPNQYFLDRPGISWEERRQRLIEAQATWEGKVLPVPRYVTQAETQNETP